jgi:hypothetical protein
MSATDCYIREDMMHVTVGDDPIPWGLMTGGDARSASSYQQANRTTPLGAFFEPIELARIRSDKTVAWIAKWASRTGHTVELRAAHLNADGNPTGYGLIFDGSIVAARFAAAKDLKGLIGVVTPANYNANSSNIAMDRLTIQPTAIRALGD